jgi:hypothetical protein
MRGDGPRDDRAAVFEDRVGTRQRVSTGGKKSKRMRTNEKERGYSSGLLALEKEARAAVSGDRVGKK